MDYNHSLMTIAELPNFFRQAEKLRGYQERQDAKNTRSNLSNPQRHELFELTSQLVKVWLRKIYGTDSRTKCNALECCQVQPSPTVQTQFQSWPRNTNFEDLLDVKASKVNETSFHHFLG